MFPFDSSLRYIVFCADTSPGLASTSRCTLGYVAVLIVHEFQLFVIFMIISCADAQASASDWGEISFAVSFLFMFLPRGH